MGLTNAVVYSVVKCTKMSDSQDGCRFRPVGTGCPLRAMEAGTWRSQLATSAGVKNALNITSAPHIRLRIMLSRRDSLKYFRSPVGLVVMLLKMKRIRADCCVLMRRHPALSCEGSTNNRQVDSHITTISSSFLAVNKYQLEGDDLGLCSGPD